MTGFKAKLGRQLKLTGAAAREFKMEVCLAIAEGKNIHEIARRRGMSPATILGCMVGDPEFRSVYREAKEMYFTLMAEEIVDIIDNPNIKTSLALEQAKEQVKARQWVVSRALRKQWGNNDTVTVAGDPDNPVRVEDMGFDDRIKRLQAIFSVAAQRIAEKRVAVEVGESKDVEESEPWA